MQHLQRVPDRWVQIQMSEMFQLRRLSGETYTGLVALYGRLYLTTGDNISRNVPPTEYQRLFVMNDEILSEILPDKDFHVKYCLKHA